VLKEVSSDVASARERDPAARGIGTLEILTGWAGVQALLAHRVAHALWEAEIPLAPRVIAYNDTASTSAVTQMRSESSTVTRTCGACCAMRANLAAIPCLNDSPGGMAVIRDIVTRELKGWV